MYTLRMEESPYQRIWEQIFCKSIFEICSVINKDKQNIAIESSFAPALLTLKNI